VVRMNDWQKSRFARHIVKELFNTVSGKRIAVLGFAFKKDTNDTRETAAISVCRDLLEEGATVVVYDPRVSAEQIRLDTLGNKNNPNLIIADSALAACANTHAIAVLTEWDEFKNLDFAATLHGMHKPAFVFDGRNVLPHQALSEMGYRVYAMGKPRPPLI